LTAWIALTFIWVGAVATDRVVYGVGAGQDAGTPVPAS
jgi:hypothetical protein